MAGTWMRTGLDSPSVGTIAAAGDLGAVDAPPPPPGRAAGDTGGAGGFGFAATPEDGDAADRGAEAEDEVDAAATLVGAGVGDDTADDEPAAMLLPTTARVPSEAQPPRTTASNTATTTDADFFTGCRSSVLGSAPGRRRPNLPPINLEYCFHHRCPAIRQGPVAPAGIRSRQPGRPLRQQPVPLMPERQQPERQRLRQLPALLQLRRRPVPQPLPPTRWWFRSIQCWSLSSSGW